MRRFTVVTIVLSLLFSCFTFFSPQHAFAQEPICYVFSLTVINSDTIPHTLTMRFRDSVTDETFATGSLTLSPGETGTLRLAAFIPAGVSLSTPVSGTGLDLVSYTLGPADASECAGGGVAMISDGRVNGTDLAAPAAVYCENGGIAVWDISDEGDGMFGFTVTAEQIEAALASAATSGQNVLVGEGLGNSLYALATNELALVGPDIKEPSKTYMYIMAADVCA